MQDPTALYGLAVPNTPAFVEQCRKVSDWVRQIPLGFGLLLIAGIMIYVYKIQLKYYTVTQSLSQMGVGVRATPISSFAMLSSGATFTPEEAPKKLKIDGPGFVAVGDRGSHCRLNNLIGTNRHSDG